MAKKIPPQQQSFFEQPNKPVPNKTNAEILADPTLQEIEVERHPHGLPEDILATFERLMLKAGPQFRESVRYPAFMQHSYVMGRFNPEFVKFMALIIGKYGYEGQFMKWTNKYLEIGDYKYWVLGEPADIVNREHINVARLRKRMGK